MVRIVLASTSRYRRELVERLGLAIECVAPTFDEEAAKPALAHRPPHELVVELARSKALSLSEVDPDAIVIGADQVAEIDGVILGKPHTYENAEAQLARMAGRTHRLVTGIAVAKGRRVETTIDVHHMQMRPLNARAIASYVRRDSPLDCAGSYRIESLGIALFESLRGDDFTAIVGLPLTRVVDLLARFDVSVL